jgi:DMSO/TMAO reductase YedYZ molybdopterin-dependent catalytic subunit
MLDHVSGVDEASAHSVATVPRPFGALAGLVAGAVAVTVGMFVARVLDVVSPIDAVGGEFIDRVPSWLREQAIQWFGTNDKRALRVGIVITLAIAAVIVGVLATRWLIAGIAGIAIFGLIGMLAALHRPGSSASAVVPPLIGTLVGIPVLLVLIRPRGVHMFEAPDQSRATLEWDRRRFLATTGTAAAGAVLAGGISELLERRRVDAIRQSISDSLPPVTGSPSGSGVGAKSPVVPDGATVDPVTPFITPNDDFYRIDTALSFPNIDVSTWKLDIGGMVDRPLTLTYNDLLARSQVERIVTLCCVSNEVGGSYISTAAFRGVLLADLLREAGVHSGAQQVFSTSLDGWTSGFPVAVAMDGRDAMIAVGMNGAALPLEHGFPARIVVPGLYGYVSATKWLRKIELTTWDADVGYWVPLGWAREAPVKTQSRIDVPRHGERVASGSIIEKVEVRIDEGDWHEARLGSDVTDDAWRQWVYDWTADPGKYTVQVRATDKTGTPQTDQVAPPDPDGATGYHTRTVTVI